MSLLVIIMIALALAMDAFAVSIASGAAARKFRLKHALSMGAWFGGFQALMPCLGWLGGIRLSKFIAGVDHWIAFGLLFVIGCKMIYEAFKIEDAEEKASPGVYLMFLLALATSIDALAVGFSFAMISVAIILPAALIGAVTFVVSFAGVLVGSKGLHLLGKKTEIVAGLILIGIGIRILVAHLF